MRVVAPPQRPSAAILYSNPLGCPCTLSGDLHGGHTKYQKSQSNCACAVAITVYVLQRDKRCVCERIPSFHGIRLLDQTNSQTVCLLYREKRGLYRVHTYTHTHTHTHTHILCRILETIKIGQMLQ